MYAKALIVSALAVMASAQQVAPIMRRDFPLKARQTGLSDPTCTSALSALLPIYQSVPTPPPELASVSFPSDPCATPTFTGVTASAYSAYVSSASAWVASHSAEIFGALSKCPALTQYASGVPVCTGGSSGGAATTAGSGSSAGAVTTGGAASSGAAASSRASSAAANTSAAASATQSVVTKNAAPRETGFFAAGMAAAGLAVAVAAL